MLKNSRISEFAVTLTLSVKIKKLSKEHITINNINKIEHITINNINKIEHITINNINKIATFSGFSFGCCINEEKVIYYQLELGK